MSNFDIALRYVLQNEVLCDAQGNPIPGKQFEDDPHDPGGMTTFGIIASEYAAWLHEPKSWIGIAECRKMMKSMTLADASAIYHQNYWNPFRCSDITEQAIATAIMDASVNPGQGYAAKAVQRIVGVAVDGRIGPITIAAVNRTSATDFITALRIENRGFYDERAKKNSVLNRYLLGWHNRADRLLTLIS